MRSWPRWQLKNNRKRIEQRCKSKWIKCLKGNSCSKWVQVCLWLQIQWWWILWWVEEWILEWWATQWWAILWWEIQWWDKVWVCKVEWGLKDLCLANQTLAYFELECRWEEIQEVGVCLTLLDQAPNFNQLYSVQMPHPLTNQNLKILAKKSLGMSFQLLKQNSKTEYSMAHLK